MSPYPFDRLFSMAAFEGLRLLRKHVELRPEEPLELIQRIVKKVEPDAAAYDLTASCYLHTIVDPEAPHQGVGFYRSCLSAVLVIEMPAWAKLMTMGRGRFIKRLKGEEYRDIRSLFRQARLLDEPPSDEDIGWWDAIQASVRQHADQEKLRMARQAEKLTLEHERAKLKNLGIDAEPKWVAIDDNTAGYDVLSFEPSPSGPVAQLIEVKSTIASPLRFYLTRNEWEQALQVGEAYRFHLWDMSKSPPILYERRVHEVAPHVPQDVQKGAWKTAQLPIHLG